MTLMRQATRRIPLGGLGDGETVTLPFPQVLDNVNSTVSYPTDSGGFNWNSLATNLVSIAKPILNAQFGGPQPGQYSSYNPQTGAYVNYALPNSSTPYNSGFPSGTVFDTSNISGILPYLLIGGVALFAISAMFGKRG